MTRQDEWWPLFLNVPVQQALRYSALMQNKSPTGTVSVLMFETRIRICMIRYDMFRSANVSNFLSCANADGG
jgi:hypothetical protein